MVGALVFVVCGYVCLICGAVPHGGLALATGIILANLASAGIICAKIEKAHRVSTSPPREGSDECKPSSSLPPGDSLS